MMLYPRCEHKSQLLHYAASFQVGSQGISPNDFLGLAY
jgi:hypothetical protein